MGRAILIVDDDPSIHAGLVRLVRDLGYEPTESRGAADAIARLGDQRFDLCVVDLGLPAGEGAAVVMKARACRPAVTTVALTSQGSVANAVEALRAGASDVVAKPFQAAALEGSLRRLDGRIADHPGGGRTVSGPAVIGDHPAMRAVLEQVDRVADTDASILIRGETGTGKEVIARLIHNAGRRRSGPFVAVNMAAIPEPLAEAELFGYVRGAFTGAERPRLGRLLSAQGGTLFLDEIGEMPRSVQAKLLRVLQEREVTPVGGGAPVRVDVRVVAATHRDLEAMVEQNRFRADLYYRLDVLPIEIPPLRARRADIPALVDHFRREVNAREGRCVPGFAPEVLQRLTAYDWPGNVRELENLVERLVVLAGNRMVAMNDLPPHLRTEVLDLEAAFDLPAAGVDLRLLLTGLEESFISQALERTGGNRNRAADLLRLNRTTLVEKLRRRNVA